MINKMIIQLKTIVKMPTFASSKRPNALRRLPKSLRTQYKS